LRRLAVSGKHRAPHQDQTIMGAAARPLEAAAASGSFKRELGATLALGWPIILANVAIYTMTATDFIMLGRLSPQALAAGALGFNLFQPAMVLGIGIVAALSPIAAAKIGAGESGEALRRATH
jgi:MATE family multidrug resistance protein